MRYTEYWSDSVCTLCTNAPAVYSTECAQVVLDDPIQVDLSVVIIMEYSSTLQFCPTVL